VGALYELRRAWYVEGVLSGTERPRSSGKIQFPSHSVLVDEALAHKVRASAIQVVPPGFSSTSFLSVPVGANLDDQILADDEHVVNVLYPHSFRWGRNWDRGPFPRERARIFL